MHCPPDPVTESSAEIDMEPELSISFRCKHTKGSHQRDTTASTALERKLHTSMTIVISCKQRKAFDKAAVLFDPLSATELWLRFSQALHDIVVTRQ
jgi:hypothetical protein